MGNASGTGTGKRSPSNETPPDAASASDDLSDQVLLRKKVNEAMHAWDRNKETIRSVSDFSEHEKKLLQDSWYLNNISLIHLINSNVHSFISQRKHLEQDIAQVGIIVFIK